MKKYNNEEKSSLDYKTSAFTFIYENYLRIRNTRYFRILSVFVPWSSNFLLQVLTLKDPASGWAFRIMVMMPMSHTGGPRFNASFGSWFHLPGTEDSGWQQVIVQAAGSSQPMQETWTGFPGPRSSPALGTEGIWKGDRQMGAFLANWQSYFQTFSWS